MLGGKSDFSLLLSRVHEYKFFDFQVLQSGLWPPTDVLRPTTDVLRPPTDVLWPSEGDDDSLLAFDKQQKTRNMYRKLEMKADI